MKKPKKPELYMSVFHHKHGTSFCLLAVPDGIGPEVYAEDYWIKADGLEANEDDRADAGEYVVTIPAYLASKKYKLKLEKIR